MDLLTCEKATYLLVLIIVLPKLCQLSLAHLHPDHFHFALAAGLLKGLGSPGSFHFLSVLCTSGGTKDEMTTVLFSCMLKGFVGVNNHFKRSKN